MKEVDICILVIASRNSHYDNLINNYWSKMIKFVKKMNINIKIYLLFGNNVNTSDLKLDDDDKLILNINECWRPGIIIKTLKALEFVNNNYKYKHIFRTNLSSFLILDNLIKISKKLDDTNIYAGVVGIYDNWKYVSGAGIWLSKDNVNILIKNNNKIIYFDRVNRTRKFLLDDVIIGIVLNAQKKTGLKRKDLTSNIEISNKKELFNNIKKDHYHIRIKNSNYYIDYNYTTAFTQLAYTL